MMRLVGTAVGLAALLGCEDFKTADGFGLEDTAPYTTSATSIPTGSDITCAWFESENCWTAFRDDVTEACALGGGGVDGLFDPTMQFCAYADGSGSVALAEPFPELPRWNTDQPGFTVTGETSTCLVVEDIPAGIAMTWGDQTFEVYIQGTEFIYVCPDSTAYRAEASLFKTCGAMGNGPGVLRSYVAGPPEFVTATLGGASTELFRCEAP